MKFKKKYFLKCDLTLGQDSDLNIKTVKKTILEL